MSGRTWMVRLALAGLICASSTASAEIDGHGPDAWRVTNVAADDVLNARMGPGTQYPVIDAFDHDARDLQQVTCVPLLIAGVQEKLTREQREGLPTSWCLMRSADLSRSGWVRQHYLMPDGAGTATVSPTGDAMIAEAVSLVRSLYANADPYAAPARHPLDPANARNYFSADVVAAMRSQPPQADPLFGAQDFDGSYGEPFADPDQPMFRGMITVNVEIVNFGRRHTAVVRLRADPAQPGSPIRVVRIEHDGWSFP
ncbi:hypothetical protein [Pelagerythrobacter marensis]|uniref:SH3b domain-containing protein n=1 Tax=Pelagerythrobacter marensis TaxID=543877 RepID=A0A0G3X862_9SPHN|nr:hypothetical protein [Pelagerythrobacter marensis]AKM06804.1 hypothetical protein AM2010_721 [Pelagerythrobacter marensis]